MELTRTLRFGAGALATLLALYSGYEVYYFSHHWYSLEELEIDTECHDIHSLELWQLSQNVVCLLSAFLGLTMLFKPITYTHLQTIFPILGGIHFAWTTIGLVHFLSFRNCCEIEADDCENYYPDVHPVRFSFLLAASFVLSVILMLHFLYSMGSTLLKKLSLQSKQYTTSI